MATIGSHQYDLKRATVAQDLLGRFRDGLFGVRIDLT